MTDSTSIPIHGNYRGYYTKRPSFGDSRLSLIAKDVFDSARVLDVGCNEGWVTCEIAQHLGAREVVGVDIDDSLIRSAWKRRRTVWSQSPPKNSTLDPTRAHPPLKKLESTHDSKASGEENHEVKRLFPMAFEHMFGPLPIPPAASIEERVQFPHNVVFRCTNWPQDGAVEDRDGYDVILALSISKWIHLNNGDDGILAFFQRAFSVLRPGGSFILEPQEWESYHKAKRMDPKLRKNAELLRLRPSDFEGLLMKIGFRSVERLKNPGNGGFQRGLDLYRK